MLALAVRGQRNDLGWTMAELAERSGLSRDVISDIENGRRDSDGMRRRAITVDELLILAEALGIESITIGPRKNPSYEKRVDPEMLEERQSAAMRLRAEIGAAHLRVAQEYERMEKAKDELTRAQHEMERARREMHRSEGSLARLEQSLSRLQSDAGHIVTWGDGHMATEGD
jgi:transcriptional regulator with XRE-family HTH domain